MKKVLVLAPPPTPNGDLHVGHLSGPYLRADIYARYSRMLGNETYYLCGIDEHQSYVALKGRQIGLGPQETADRFAAEIEQTLSAAHIQIDLIARPSRLPHHRALVEKLFHQLHREGRIVEREESCLFCNTCQMYLFEAYVRGFCPHCDEPSGGNSCEACGRPNDCRDLRRPVCNICGTRANFQNVMRSYLPLSPYEKQLQEYLETATMSSNVRSLCEQMIKDGLPEVAVTHPANWGLSVPGSSGQKIYVWFEMAAGLLAATQALSEAIDEPGGWERFWKSTDVEIVKFLGFDNTFFYSLFFSAIFQAWDREIRLPQALLANEFYRLDGLKFSTSRNHAIWGSELLRDQNVDLVRFYLSYTGPETEQTSFTLAEYEQAVRRELLDGVQGWLHQLGSAVSNEYSGIAPSPGVWTETMHSFYGRLNDIVRKTGVGYSAKEFSTQRVARLLLDLAREARFFSHSEGHWKRVSDRRLTRNTAIALELLAAKTLALLSAPIMPGFAARLWQDLGQTKSLQIQSWPHDLEWVRPGTLISNLNRNYFDKYEDVKSLSRPVAAHT
ncbi:MAG: class I tRNA ligase family protein [Acidobacteriia bacterium]|nr:class I tRNA ligase family protein [Terriglobia bacterium]